MTHHIYMQYCSLEADCYDILKRTSSFVCQLLHKERLCSSEVYDQIYQYKSRNSINPGQEEKREKTDKVRGQPGSSISLCASRETARAVGGRHNQTETQIENRQGQEDTETGE